MKNKNNNGFVKTLSLNSPSLKDNTADVDRLVHSLKNELDTDHVAMELDLVRRLPHLMREWDYNLDCILYRDGAKWGISGIEGADDPSPVCGIAVDLGTTRVVMRIVDLVSGRTLGQTAFDNPQIEIGPDILARIHHTDTDLGLDRLNRAIVNGMNENIETLARSYDIDLENIHSMTVAGNTAMTHLFLKLDPHWIIREPYIPVVNRPGVMDAKALGIAIAPDAKVLTFPNIGSYFGGDLIAGILYSGMDSSDETSILVDVGTNAEVVLGNSQWLIACAGAAGPALEGGVTRMGAGPGVIDKVKINPDTRKFSISTIENHDPRGICGSGLIDLAAQLFLAGMIDIRGRLLPSECGRRYKRKEEVDHLVVVDKDESATRGDLTISQVDLDSLIRSKAAMYTILETLTSTVGIQLEELEKFYVAGTFGSFIDPKSAISIGMIPDLPLSCYDAIGNSSLGGATMAMTDPECHEQIDRIRDRITYIELNVNQELMNRFSAAKFLPHTDRTRFPSVKF